jgi:hypothetical protein
LAELTKPAAVPIFKNSRLSMATPFSTDFLLDLENGTIVHPSRLLATL